jgi:hypothetical protein
MEMLGGSGIAIVVVIYKRIRGISSKSELMKNNRLRNFIAGTPTPQKF